MKGEVRKTYNSSNDIPESTGFKPTPPTPRAWFPSELYNIVDWSGCSRLLLRKALLGGTPQEQAEEAPRPPAESECLDLEINIQIVLAIKNCRQTHFSLSLSTV
ncbi:hypothetical protein ABH916_000193 [Peribacillus frigoritolerans]